MANLKLQNLTKRYGKVTALDDLSLEVENGEFMVILGPSGAGKTTTLKVIAGVERLNDGRVYIGDQLVNAIEPHHRNVAMAFESYALYPHKTVFDNMAFPLRAPGSTMSSTEVTKKVTAVAETLNIHMLLDRQPRMLSNGQKQRVALGRALVRDPEILLLDEPISHLDAKLRHRMRTEFKALESSIHTTTLYVTHDYLEALSLGDRLAVLRNGKIEQIGKPHEVFNKPVDTFVAKILGHPQINLMSCTVTRSGDALQLVNDDGSICVNVPPKLRSPLETANLDKALLGVRPMHMHAANGREPDANSFEAGVYVYERLGTRGVLTLSSGEQQLDVLTSIERDFEIDERVRINIDVEEIMIFDPSTEKNIVFNGG